MGELRLAQRRTRGGLRRAGAVALTIGLVAWLMAVLDSASAAEPELQPLIQRSIIVDGVQRDYWVYVPEDFAKYRLFDPKDNPLVVVLHPDGTDGEGYAAETAWASLAEDRNFVAVFPSAEAGAWDLDDADYVEAVTDAARSEWKSNELFTYLVGEGSGAGVANAVAATAATKFVGVLSLGGAAPSSLWQDPGLDTTSMAAWQVVVGKSASADEQAQVDHWKQQNGVAGPTPGAQGFGIGRTSISKNPANPLAQVRVSNVKDAADLRSDEVAESVYDIMFRPTLRFSDRDSTNGTLIRYQSADDLGLREFKADLSGYERRWYVYVPKKYKQLSKGGREVPLVMVYHGRNGSFRYVAQQTRWAEVAEARGFIAVFVQADPAPGTSPFANLGFSASLSTTNSDVAATLSILDSLEEEYAVDEGRVFLTGVSQGAAFTNRLAVQYPERFAGIAPCYSGHLSASSYQDTTVVRRDVPLPVWQCAGVNELPSDFPGGTAGAAAARTFWGETVNHHAGPPEVQVDGRYTTDVFTDGLAEYRWTLVDDIGHFMAPDLSFKIWDELFAHYERGSDGSLTRH